MSKQLLQGILPQLFSGAAEKPKCNCIAFKTLQRDGQSLHHG